LPRHKLTDEESKRGNQFKTGEEQAKIARKGGIASGKSKRAAKSMAQLAEMIAKAPISSTKTKSQLKKMGIEATDDLTNQAVVVAAVYMAAASGDIKAVEKWQELTENLESGENGVQVIIDV
jgi:hypothetical protein